MTGRSPRPFVSAVLLAAGESTRMGSPKPLLPWLGGTLVQYQVDTLLQAGASRVIVVTGHRARDVARSLAGKAVTLVENEDYASGRASSVRAGMAKVDVRTTAVLVLGVDQPRPPELVSRVVQAHVKARALITVPSYEGRGGHPVVFSATLLPELRTVTDETQGLREVMQRHQGNVQRVPVDTEVAVLDLNTPEEYARGQALFPGLTTH